jgi:hypothetical protein
MDSSDVKSTIAGGDTVKDAVDALHRIVRRAGRIATVAKRRYERNKTPEGEHLFLLAAQEYYYVSKLAADFRAAALVAVAQRHADKSFDPAN